MDLAGYNKTVGERNEIQQTADYLYEKINESINQKSNHQ